MYSFSYCQEQPVETVSPEDHKKRFKADLQKTEGSGIKTLIKSRVLFETMNVPDSFLKAGRDIKEH